jgi:aspartyl aminopeptidase
LGKVDEGGGGTIAYILSKLGAEVLDCGVGLMGMHSFMNLVLKPIYTPLIWLIKHF